MERSWQQGFAFTNLRAKSDDTRRSPLLAPTWRLKTSSAAAELESLLGGQEPKQRKDVGGLEEHQEKLRTAHFFQRFSLKFACSHKCCYRIVVSPRSYLKIFLGAHCIVQLVASESAVLNLFRTLVCKRLEEPLRRSGGGSGGIFRQFS